jgi:hypothetical protein
METVTMQIVQLYDEVALLGSLSEKTIELIHATNAMSAIKKLTNIYDILAINLDIEKRFKPYEGSPPWDYPAFKEMNHYRIELLLYHRDNFSPIYAVDRYSTKMLSFLNILQLKHTNFSI